MAGLLNIGLTGLNAAQLQLNTTSHNIANAATPGYSRQTVVQTTNEPMFSGVGFFGQGVRVAAVNRQYSQFLENQVLSADNRRAEYSAYSGQIAQLNNMLADSDVGLSPVLQAFFAGVQDVAANPSSVPARQAMISAGEALAAQFRALDSRMAEIRQGTEGEIGATVDTINSLAKQVAELNQRIAVAQAAGAGVAPNDLLDQRNNVVSELNKLVKTSTVLESDGQLSVFIGSGQNLVLGNSVTQLGTAPNALDPERQDIVLIAPNGAQIAMPESLVQGGALGGLLAFRRDALDPSQNRLNLLARSITEAFNAQHTLGVDLDGNLGQDFFNSTLVQRESGTSAAPQVSIADDNVLTSDRYRLTYTDATGGYSLVRLPDNAPVALPSDIGLSITPPATSTPGDSFIIEPLRNAARDMGLAFTDPRLIAAGSPVSVNVPATNAGTGKIDQIDVGSVDGMASGYPQFADFNVSFAANTLTVPAGYTITPAAYDPAAESAGKSFTVTGPGGYEFSFRLAGLPQNGDTFTFQPTAEGVSDNRNAVALGALQTARTMLTSAAGEPTTNFQSAYSQLVTLVGNKAREAQVGEAAQETLLQQASDARDALSGVNLDEEAANLIRYQLAYQASGRVMSIAQRLFDELLSIGR